MDSDDPTSMKKCISSDHLLQLILYKLDLRTKFTCLCVSRRFNERAKACLDMEKTLIMTPDEEDYSFVEEYRSVCPQHPLKPSCMVGHLVLEELDFWKPILQYREEMDITKGNSSTSFSQPLKRRSHALQCLGRNGIITQMNMNQVEVSLFLMLVSGKG